MMQRKLYDKIVTVISMRGKMIGVCFFNAKNVKCYTVEYRESRRVRERKNIMSQNIIFDIFVCALAFLFFYPVVFLLFLRLNIYRNIGEKKVLQSYILVVVVIHLRLL